MVPGQKEEEMGRGEGRGGSSTEPVSGTAGGLCHFPRSDTTIVQ